MSFISNALLILARHRDENIRPRVKQPIFAKAILATGNYPNVALFIEMTAEIPDDQGFERALDLILNGVAAEIQLYGRSRAAKQGKEA